MEKNKLFDTLVVVKRSGQRTEFVGEKIALAIKKAFDSVENDYKREDVNKIYNNVLKIIESRYEDRKTIKIEDIQDIIEENLKKFHFTDVYESFKTYREQRALSRETFVIKQQHKFLKAIESLGLNSLDRQENAIQERSSNEVLDTFGITIAKEFARAYLIDNKYVRAHDSGLIHMDYLEYVPTGTTSSIQIDLERILKQDIAKVGMKQGFHTISDYTHFAYLVIRANHNDQYGNQSIEAIDHAFAPGVLKTFQSSFLKKIMEFLEYNGFLELIHTEKLEYEIEHLNCISFPIETFQSFYGNSDVLKNGFMKAMNFALEETVQLTKEACCLFFEKLNSLYSKNHLKDLSTSCSFGTDTSHEAVLVSQVLLDILQEHSHFQYPNCFFKMKDGINANEDDPNFPLLLKALKTVSMTNLLHFSFLDQKYNAKLYQKNDYNSEVAYTTYGERVYDDITTSDVNANGGKGCLGYTYINIPHIALKYQNMNTSKLKLFYQELDEVLELATDSLLERFEIQCGKHNYNFPFLIEQGIWLDGEKVKPTDRLRKILKHGTLSIGIVGLNEAVIALTKDGINSKEGYKIALDITTYIRKQLDAYSLKNNLNFVLSGIKNDYSEKRFMNIDKAIYGKVKGVTDKEAYSTSFTFPNDQKELEKVGIFQSLTNGGHLWNMPITKKEIQNIKQLYTYLKDCKKNQIGCMKFYVK